MQDGYTTCASAMLRNYRSPIDATCVQLIQDAGATVYGKSNLDEFGMGTATTNSIHGRTLLADGLSPGGSSGGSAVAVKNGLVNAALGTDTGGSVRLPAAYCGIVGFKPSYGRISRFGVIPYANSLDTVGIMTNTVSDAREIFRVLDKYDSMDPTSLDPDTRAQIRTRPRDGKVVIGIAEEFLPASIDQAVIDNFRSACAALQDKVELRFVSIPSVRSALSAYYIIAPAEASSNLSRYDGVRYGAEMSDTPDYAAARGSGFGKEVRRRIVLGTFSLLSNSIDNYYLRAAKIRRILQHEFDAVFAVSNPLREAYDAPFDGVDALLTPVTLSRTLPLAEAIQPRTPTDIYMKDTLTVPSSLAGMLFCYLYAYLNSRTSVDQCPCWI